MSSSRARRQGWLASPPSAESARPGSCVVCGEARRPVGDGLGLHGHGLRDRQSRGPLDPDIPPTTTGHVGAEHVEYVLRHEKGLTPAPPLRLGNPVLDALSLRDPDLSLYGSPPATDEGSDETR